MRILLMALVVAGAAAGGWAGEFGCPACSQCGGACVLQARPVMVEETCHEVECEKICIPAVRFPWDCGPARCGRARLVSKLTTEKVERPDCEYEWVPVCERCNGLPASPSTGPAGVPPLPPPATKADAGGSAATATRATSTSTIRTAARPASTPAAAPPARAGISGESVRRQVYRLVPGETSEDRSPVNPFGP